MAKPPKKLLRSLPPLAAGLLLGAAGWLAGGHGETQALDFQPQLVVRPASAEVVASHGPAPTPDSGLAGRFSFQEAGFEIELRQKGWPTTRADVEEPRGMTTVRAKLPNSSLAVSVKGDKESEATLTELPKKTKLPLKQGRVNLEPGRHELLVQADGYLPKRLSITLKPGERKEVAVDLEAIPGFPGSPGAAGLPSLPPQAPPRQPSTAATGSRPPAYTPPPAYAPPAYAPPVYRPPAYRPPTSRPPSPVPRFTPVAPPPQPAAPDPVPMFTPIGN